MPMLEKASDLEVDGMAHGRRRCRPRHSYASAQIYLVDKPDAAQSQIRIGWVGVPRSTPDYFPLAGAQHDSRRRRSRRG